MQRCTHCNKSEVFAKMLHILHIYAQYAVYAVYAQYAPSHILHICCISSIRTPGRPPKTYPGQGAYFPFFAYIYSSKCNVFLGRCIYMGGRCICSIFGIFLWNHGSGLPERDLDVDRRTAVVERLALLPAVNSEFCHCVPIKKGLVQCWS
jgi:hypothetical protein